MNDIYLNSLVYKGEHANEVIEQLRLLEGIRILRLTVCDDSIDFESEDRMLSQVLDISMQFAGDYKLTWGQDMTADVGRFCIKEDGTTTINELTEEFIDEQVELLDSGLYLFEGEEYENSFEIYNKILDSHE